MRPPADRLEWRWGIDIALAVVLGGMAFADGLASADFPQPGTATALLMGAAGASLVLGRVRPTLGICLALGLMAVCALGLGHFQSGTSVLIGLVASVRAGLYGARPVAVVATITVFAVADAQRSWPALLFDTVFVVGVLGVAAAAGYAVRRWRAVAAAQEAGRQLAEGESALLARAAVEAERARVARELHDILSHSLGVVVLQTGAADHAWDSDPQRARQAVRDAGATSREALEQLRALLAVVRDAPDADRVPLPGIDDLRSLAARTTDAGFPVVLDVEGVARPVPAQVQASVYRVAQEGIANAMKHSGGAGCRLRLVYEPDRILVEVLDPGGSPAAAAGSRLGLVGVQERAALFGGTFEAGPVEGGGWRLGVALPG